MKWTLEININYSRHDIELHVYNISVLYSIFIDYIKRHERAIIITCIREIQRINTKLEKTKVSEWQNCLPGMIPIVKHKNRVESLSFTTPTDHPEMLWKNVFSYSPKQSTGPPIGLEKELFGSLANFALRTGILSYIWLNIQSLSVCNPGHSITRCCVFSA